MSLTSEHPAVTLTELVRALREQQSGPPAEPFEATAGHRETAEQQDDCCASNIVIVLAAHPGAGASVVSVAIADAASRTVVGTTPSRTRLVDNSPHNVSGLVCAADRELGTDEAGWHIGSREGVEVWRPPTAQPLTTTLAGLRQSDLDRVIIDAGCDIGDLKALGSGLNRRGKVVLVCRASVPGVRHAETALRCVGAVDAIAVVGTRRLPGMVRASLGPRLKAADAAHHLVLVPHDRRLEVAGIEAEPLPKPVAAAGRRLARLVWPPATAATDGGKE